MRPRGERRTRGRTYSEESEPTWFKNPNKDVIYSGRNAAPEQRRHRREAEGRPYEGGGDGNSSPDRRGRRREAKNRLHKGGGGDSSDDDDDESWTESCEEGEETGRRAHQHRHLTVRQERVPPPVLWEVHSKTSKFQLLCETAMSGGLWGVLEQEDEL